MREKRRKNKIKRKIYLFCLFLIILIIPIFYFKFNTPIINIVGDEIVSVKVYDKYVDQGFEINKKRLKNKVKVFNNVDTNKIGIYDVKYSIKYYNKNIEKIRKVKVEDNESPIIELKGDNEIKILENVNYEELGYSVKDNYDKDIEKKVKISNNIKDEIGKYEVIYSVEDSSGNKTSVKRIVNRVKNINNGVIYLTFDDGPSSSTNKILDILKEENIKATFFVVNYADYYNDAIKRIVDEGHTIALHSYTHNYKLIYSSEDAYFDDLYKLRNRVKNTTGVESNIVRFPGGSSNTISGFNKGIMTRLVRLVKEKGFHYFDWNVDSSDAWSARNSTDVYNNVINGLRINRNNVVLMHDAGSNIKTLEALPKIIKEMKNEGYTFEKITYDTPMVVHGVNN